MALFKSLTLNSGDGLTYSHTAFSAVMKSGWPKQIDSCRRYIRLWLEQRDSWPIELQICDYKIGFYIATHKTVVFLYESDGTDSPTKANHYVHKFSYPSGGDFNPLADGFMFRLIEELDKIKRGEGCPRP